MPAVAPLPELSDDDALIALVRPSDWRNPRPKPAYDLVVLGGGTAGLVSAVGAAGLGARVALVERDRLGGDCLNTGCVPSKALLRSARAAHEARRASTFGVRTGAVSVDFADVMARMRTRRAGLAPNDSAARLAGVGVDVFFGGASFLGPREIGVGDERLRFGRAVIATGSRPAVPALDGLSETPFLTSDTVFSLSELPRRLLLVGAGPIGCELAQAFARFGSDVVLFDQSPRVLPNEDAGASEVVEHALVRDGVRLELATAISNVSRRDAEVVIRFTRGSGDPAGEHAGDCLLVACSRVPAISHLGLEQAGIAHGPRGVIVDDHLRTANKRVYAAGDVCSRFAFTHAADAMARIVVQNALFMGRRKVSALTIPWCTYTEPEVAHVGLSAEAAASRPGVQTISVSLAHVDRAVLDDATDGFVRVHHERGRLLGCTIVAPGAGELIGLAASAVARRASVGEFAAAVLPYPTYAEALRKAGDAYRRTLLTPRLKRVFERYLQWTRW